jgi:N-acetylneuraminate synthase
MKIAGRTIGSNEPPYIVADISASHNHDLARGFDLIEIAKECGADAVKFQAYTPEGVSLDMDRAEFVIKSGPWAGYRLFDLYTKAHTPRDMLAKLFDHAANVGITAFSTACTEDDVDFLETLGNPAIKIASLDIVNLPLIEHAASKGKPVIISTGMANDDDVWEAYANANGCSGGALFLHCVSAYPCALEDANLSLIREWRASDIPFGYSDHTIGHEAAVMAIALGAVMIEKHLTLSREDGGPDDHFATEPREFAAMVDAVHAAWQAMCEPEGKTGDEAHQPLRPSIWAIQDIAAGEPFTRENVRAIRPAGGLPPKELPDLLLCRAATAIARGTPISLEHVE